MVLVVKRWVAAASLGCVFAVGGAAGWAATAVWPRLPLAAGGESRTGAPPAGENGTEPVPGRWFRFGANDTLSGISKRAYGTTRRVPDLLAANPGLDPERIRPGTPVYVPYEGERPAEPTREAKPSAPAPAAAAPERGEAASSKPARSR